MLTVHSKDSLFIFLASLNGKKNFLFQGQGRGRSCILLLLTARKSTKEGVYLLRKAWKEKLLEVRMI